MARVKRGVIARARHKKVLDRAKGYYGARSRVYRVAFQAVIKAGQYAYRDRRQKKRQFRQLWIARINAAARSFHHFARYAFDARQQAQELEAWIWRRVNRNIVQNTPSLAARYFNLRHALWDTRLHFERKSYLLDRDVTEEQWLNLWNPRR